MVFILLMIKNNNNNNNNNNNHNKRHVFEIKWLQKIESKIVIHGIKCA